jgi:hypothetical protein
MDASTHADAVDAFDQLRPGSYPGEIAPGAFINYFEHDGNRRATLGLALDVGGTDPRIVRIGFLLDSVKALEAARRDVETLDAWAKLVDVPVLAPDWQTLVKDLWFGQQRLGVDLSFTIRPAKQGRGYNLIDVTPVL